jgi:hypothetical protein
MKCDHLEEFLLNENKRVNAFLKGALRKQAMDDSDGPQQLGDVNETLAVLCFEVPI